MIEGLNHVTLSVSDLPRAVAFYRDVLGLRPLARWREGAYLLAGESTWICLSLDTSVRNGPLAEYSHVAFSASSDGFAGMCERLRGSGAREWKRNTSEGDSFYFLDPDGHKLELHVGDWRTRLASFRLGPRNGLEFF
jgi:glutathione S-transferase fosA5